MFRYQLHIVLNKNGQLFTYIVNKRQPFSTQNIQIENKNLNIPSYGILKTHTNYILHNFNLSFTNEKEISVKFKHTIDIEVKLFKQLLLNYIELDEVYHFQFKKDRCCC